MTLMKTNNGQLSEGLDRLFDMLNSIETIQEYNRIAPYQLLVIRQLQLSGQFPIVDLVLNNATRILANLKKENDRDAIRTRYSERDW